MEGVGCITTDVDNEDGSLETNSEAVVDVENERESLGFKGSSECKQWRSNRLGPSSADIMTVTPVRKVMRSKACTSGFAACYG
jgi:hypothetical protein